MFLTPYKNGIPKDYKLIWQHFDKAPRFVTKKWIEVHDQSGNAENRYEPNKQIRFKTLMLRSDLCGYTDAYTLMLKEKLLLQIQIMMHMTRN